MSKLIVKNTQYPDELRELPKTNIKVYSFDEHTIMLLTLKPGWKWSECVKPTAGTVSCEVRHLNYILSGRLVIVMDDGTQKELGPGTLAEIPAGHDAYVIGEEPVVALDFSGGKLYGKK